MTQVDSVYPSQSWKYVSYIDIVRPNGELVVTDKKYGSGLACYYEIAERSKICIIMLKASPVDRFSYMARTHYKSSYTLDEAKKRVEMYEKKGVSIYCNRDIVMCVKIVYDTDRQTILSQKEFYKEEEYRPIYMEKKENCYIATMAYHDINHPKVQVFRMFRDNTLVNCEAGRRFISFYYEHSPSWVKVLKDKKRINYVIRKLLDGMVYFICRLYKIDFDSVNKKLDVLRSVSLEDEVVKRPSYLIQGVDLSYARVKYLKSHNVVLNHKGFNYLVLSNKEFLKKFGISNDDVRKKYSYGK